MSDDIIKDIISAVKSKFLAKRKLYELQTKHNDLICKYNTLFTDYTNLDAKYKEIIIEVIQPSDCKVDIDFNILKPFSIERIFKHEHTIIGYIIDDKVKEWILYISRDQHNKLVEEFKQYQANKNLDVIDK